jgi:hypothetical protein
MRCSPGRPVCQLTTVVLSQIDQLESEMGSANVPVRMTVPGTLRKVTLPRLMTFTGMRFVNALSLDCQAHAPPLNVRASHRQNAGTLPSLAPQMEHVSSSALQTQQSVHALARTTR